MRRMAIIWGLCLSGTCPARVHAQTEPASEPATAPTTTTATAPAERLVQWHSDFDRAVEQARKDGRLLLVVFFDPDAPAWEAFEVQTLQDIPTRRFLAEFAGVRVNAAAGEGKKRFQAAGGKETPLTQVLTPDGKLLDSIPGAIVPGEAFQRRLGGALDYWEAVGAKPFDAAAQWRAVQARLRTSTRQEAVAMIERLRRLPAGGLPEGVAPAHLDLAEGRAVMQSDPARAEKCLEQARQASGKAGPVASEALAALIELAAAGKQFKKAHQFCRDYIEGFPGGAEIARAYYYKAMLEMTALDDRDSAVKTLREFLQKHPDDKGAPGVRVLLESLEAVKPK